MLLKKPGFSIAFYFGTIYKTKAVGSVTKDILCRQHFLQLFFEELDQLLETKPLSIDP
jgi:hypothetical protein